MSESAGSSGEQVQIRFVTKQQQYAIADSPLSVPRMIQCSELNTLVNQLIRESQISEWSDTLFDFLVVGELLRLPLGEFLQERSISAEAVIDVEYLEKYPNPEPQDCLMHDDWVSAIEIKDKWILSGSYDNTVRLWSTKGKAKLVLQEHSALVKSVTWLSLDSNTGTFASASHDQTVFLWNWNIRENKAQCKIACKGHERGVNSVKVSPDKTRICTGAVDNMMKIWSASLEPDNEQPPHKRSKGHSVPVRTPMHTLKGHKEAISSVVWTENQTVCTASMDHTIKLWDVELCGVRSELIGNKSFFCADWSDFNRCLITSSADKIIRLYDPRSTEGSLVKSSFTSHTQWVQCVTWSKTEDNLFISGGFDNQVKLWDVRSPKAPLYDMVGHESKVLSCDWSHPALIASGGADNTLQIFKFRGVTSK